MKRTETNTPLVRNAATQGWKVERVVRSRRPRKAHLAKQDNTISICSCFLASVSACAPCRSCRATPPPRS